MGGLCCISVSNAQYTPAHVSAQREDVGIQLLCKLSGHFGFSPLRVLSPYCLHTCGVLGLGGTFGFSPCAPSLLTVCTHVVC